MPTDTKELRVKRISEDFSWVADTIRCTRSIRTLCDGIIASQQREIDQMSAILRRLP